MATGSKREWRDDEQLHFHYRREDRLDQAGRRPDRERGGSIFKRNRSLLIVLLDILLLLVVFGLWWGFLRAPEDSATRLGYQFDIAALSRDGRTTASLTITNRGGSPASELFDVEFRPLVRSEGPLGSESWSVDAAAVAADADVLPIPGDLRTVRASWNDRYERMEVSVEFGETEIRLRTAVR